MNMPDVKQGGTKSGDVADLLSYGQGLLEVVEGRVVVAAGLENLRDIVEGRAFAGFIADLLLNGQRLLEVVEGRVVVAQVKILFPSLY